MNLSSRTLALVIVGLVVCLFGVYILFRTPGKKQETEKNSITSSAISSPTADFQDENSKDVERLTAEISSLRQQVAQLAAITPAKAKVNKPEEKNKSPEGTMFDPQMVEKSKKEYQERMESLEDKFYSEPEDSKWSSAALSAIQEALQQNEAMRDAARKVECHSSMCRLEIADDQSEAVFKSIDSFSQNLTPDLSRLVAHRVDEGEGKGTVVLYVSNKDMLAPNQ